MKPSIPKGTRDFSPQEMVKRNYIFDTIRKVYQSYGYQPIETPAFENSETLMGKYGEEGDRLIFKILNSGNYLDGLANDLPVAANPLAQLTKHISEKALRYDLTVPFARYVVQHRNDITFPFKRYQIQPVWRADRPQKGRYREFYQCDADVIGSDSLLNEVELIQIIDEVFTKLGVPVIIKLNNRKILQGVAEYIGAPDKMIDIAIAIDKLDKIDWKGVQKELEAKGFTEEQRHDLDDFINLKTYRVFEEAGVIKHEGDIGIYNNPYLGILLENSDYKDVPILRKGAEELNEIFGFFKELETQNNSIVFDPSLARGLNYYTGTIIEVKVDTSKCASQFTSSICGGGRYDDLTGIFGLPDVSGVGISFGADRIYDVMEELGNFKEVETSTTKVLFLNFGGEAEKECLRQVKLLHEAGISAQLYPDEIKVKKIPKQFEYADKGNIPYVVIIGGDEIEKGVVKLRNMQTKEEKEMISVKLKEYLKSI